MGTIFTLTPQVKQIVQQSLDDLITELGKDCRLVYPPRMVTCPNFTADPIGHKPSNVARTGGAVQFGSEVVCPLCNGTGKQATEVSDPIRLLCSYSPKDFTRPIPQVDLRIPYGIIETKSYMSDLPRLTRADYLVVETGAEPMVRWKYKLMSEPVDTSNIIQGRYCVARWSRIVS